MCCKSKALTLMLATIFLISFLTFSYNSKANGKQTWNIQTINKNAIGESFIALDSNDNPHIVYNDFNSNSTFGTYNLMYATLNNSSWNTEIVAKQYYAIGFALDSQNNPHIIASTNRTHYPGMLTYISWTGSSWSIQTVDDQSEIEGTASLALDSENNPHIAYLAIGPLYQTPTPGIWGVYINAKYASWTGTKWNIETIDGPHLDSIQIIIAMDPNNKAHILYSKQQTLVYTVSNLSSWNIQTVISNSSYGNFILDSKGHPHIIYLLGRPDTNSHTLMYSSWNGSAWNNQTIIPNGSIENSNFGYLAIDSNNYPHVDFVINSTLYYSSWNGNTWSTEALDSKVHMAGPVIFDSSDNPHICYMGIQPNHTYLMYATTNKPTQISNKPLTIPIITVTIVIMVIIVSLSLFLNRRHRKTANLNKTTS